MNSLSDIFKNGDDEQIYSQIANPPTEYNKDAIEYNEKSGILYSYYGY
jgi:hypothetical protein